MFIGSVQLQTGVALAPMAGVTDLAFRTICRELAPVYTTTEMVSAKALSFGDEKTRRLMRLNGDEHPGAIQLFGSDPGCMAEAAAEAQNFADVIDINMGCPMPKIVSSGDGCALMRNPALAAEIVQRCVGASRAPVTVKFRKGWDRGDVNAVDFAKRLEAAGAAALCVHGRTRAQLYSGEADWGIIRDVKRAVSVPVFANGDVFTPRDARRCLALTGADMVMVGRGAFGNPWLLRDIDRELRGLESLPPPSFAQRLELAGRQILLAAEDKGERVACLEARRHLSWTVKGVRGCAQMRREIMRLTTLSQLSKLLRDMIEYTEQTVEER